ncbi:4Fe-4S ferredoxin [Methanocella sp. CWC-04]|uniref:4Fe-4S ferredoxin n=1 Tax=Methanooceanicella nereidis TaxID=2052831 RepID=A0AAP2RET9_9EURY|nr:DUF362 domain-containing protein [Methanocella sp. CWC-04]MCD1296251.1 4Fe-4S ferredoxin [Methanocella sp. CWC-04]
MTVHFVPWDTSKDLLKSTGKLYDSAGTFDCVEKGDLVAIKLHVGELGNPYYVQPFFVHQIVQKVKEAGGKPFLTDTNTYYLVKRHNAWDHHETAVINGFNFAPFIVADGLRSENERKVKTKGILDEIEVAGAIVEADAMIVVSHDKGHALTGFGGAIKNIAMGCCTSAGKLRQHRTVGLEIDESLCTGCGLCREVCELGLPEILGEKAVNVSPKCMRCPVCMEACPTGAITLADKENLSKALASATYGVLSTFKKEKVSYVSFAKDITQFCDCLPGPGRKVMGDIGVFASDSAVSADAAFLKMADYHVFNEAYEVDCMTQVKELKDLGFDGELDPEIKMIA